MARDGCYRSAGTWLLDAIEDLLPLAKERVDDRSLLRRLCSVLRLSWRCGLGRASSSQFLEETSTARLFFQLGRGQCCGLICSLCCVGCGRGGRFFVVHRLSLANHRLARCHAVSAHIDASPLAERRVQVERLHQGLLFGARDPLLDGFVQLASPGECQY